MYLAQQPLDLRSCPFQIPGTMALRCACALRGLSGGECNGASPIRADRVSQPSRTASNMLPSTFRDNAMPFAGAGGSSKCPMRPRSASSSSRLASRPRHGPHKPDRPGHGEQRQQHADGHDGRPHGGSGAAGGSAQTERAQRPLAHLKGHCEQRTDQLTSTRLPPASQTRTRTAAICGSSELTIGSFAESQRDLEKLCWSRTTLHAFLPRLKQLRRPGMEPPARINFLPETELKPCPSLHAAPQQRERDAARNGCDFRDLREKLP